MTLFSKGRMAALCLLLLSFFAFQLPAAQATAEAGRAHSSAQVALNSGANGCTVSGATAATPSVITCAAAHNLKDGDPIQITGVGGTTTINTIGYAKVTGYSTTTFGFYSDAALTTGITGTGAYTSGGKVSEALDVSSISAPYTIRLRVEALTAGSTALISIQDSADGFASDVRTIGIYNVTGSVPGNKEKTWRDYEIPSSRVGVSNGRLRVAIQALSSSSSVTTSLFVQY